MAPTSLMSETFALPSRNAREKKYILLLVALVWEFLELVFNTNCAEHFSWL